MHLIVLYKKYEWKPLGALEMTDTINMQKQSVTDTKKCTKKHHSKHCASWISINNVFRGLERNGDKDHDNDNITISELRWGEIACYPSLKCVSPRTGTQADRLARRAVTHWAATRWLIAWATLFALGSGAALSLQSGVCSFNFHSRHR